MSYTIDESIRTNKHSWLYNTREYIMLHHTSSLSASTNNVARYLAYNSAQVSCPFLVWTEYDKKIYQMCSTKAIAWHAGSSSYEWKEFLNQYAIGIEVMSSDGHTYDDRQRWAVRRLVSQLMQNYWIPNTKVIRHKDVTSRKWDIGDNFWNNEFSTFDKYRDTLWFDVVPAMPEWKRKQYDLIRRVHLALMNKIDDVELDNIWWKGNEYINNLLK